MAPRIDHYDWPGGREAMLRFGPDEGPIAIVALPLFEEGNRTRTFVVTLLRALAERGIGSVLPDVPGQGESTTALADLTIPSMAAAMRAVADRCAADGRQTYAVGLRSGALLDEGEGHRGRWRLAPQSGADLVRDLHRTWRAAGRSGDQAKMMAGADPVEIAGNLLSGPMLRSLLAATPSDPPGAPRRIVRLASDPADADRHVEAAPLWRRSEPGNDTALAALLAEDIAGWIAACEA